MEAVTLVRVLGTVLCLTGMWLCWRLRRQRFVVLLLPSHWREPGRRRPAADLAVRVHDISGHVMYDAIPREVVSRCRFLATCSDEPGYTTRTFLYESMRTVHAEVSRWMTEAGLSVGVDAAGNIRGVHVAASGRSEERRVGKEC